MTAKTARLMPMPLLDPFFNKHNDDEEELKEEDEETHNL
jgi:hypothetical protein